jgi:hypothetical protein
MKDFIPAGCDADCRGSNHGRSDRCVHWSRILSTCIKCNTPDSVFACDKLNIYSGSSPKRGESNGYCYLCKPIEKPFPIKNLWPGLHCYCDEPVRVAKVAKNGTNVAHKFFGCPNQEIGRKFYGCPNWQDTAKSKSTQNQTKNACRFFMWVPEFGVYSWLRMNEEINRQRSKHTVGAEHSEATCSLTQAAGDTHLLPSNEYICVNIRPPAGSDRSQRNEDANEWWAFMGGDLPDYAVVRYVNVM